MHISGIILHMKESFGEHLRRYTETIAETNKDFSKEGKAAAEQARAAAVEETATQSHTTPEAEIEIYKIQKAKLDKLSRFKKFLEKTRSGQGFIHPEMQQNMPVVSSDKEGNFILKDMSGKTQAITIGEILTDYEWGAQYAFDSSVNIHDIREYQLEKLKAELREKLDTQIIISETANTRGDTFKQNAYREIEKRMEGNLEQQGVIAEKMVKNFLKKLAIDTNADFEIIDADVYQDVEQKVDFIIHRTHVGRTRGAQVSESDSAEDIGIQFTTALGKQDQKEQQIAKSRKHLQGIDDLVLVTLPAHDASRLYTLWKKDKASGGPEKLWSSDIQETIFRGVMKNILTEEEIDAFCEAHLQN
jgi:hypothetical protein